jgi:hypothetical protein
MYYVIVVTHTTNSPTKTRQIINQSLYFSHAPRRCIRWIWRMNNSMDLRVVYFLFTTTLVLLLYPDKNTIVRFFFWIKGYATF